MEEVQKEEEKGKKEEEATRNGEWEDMTGGGRGPCGRERPPGWPGQVQLTRQITDKSCLTRLVIALGYGASHIRTFS